MLKYGVNDADGVSRIVGNAWTIGFMSWVQQQDLVSPVEILAGRTDKVPTRGDAVMVVSAGIVSALGGENAQGCTDKALEFAFKWWQKAAQKNFAASCMQDVRRTVHTVTAIRTSKFQKYLDQYGEVLAIAG
jgi:hypothetical protein